MVLGVLYIGQTTGEEPCSTAVHHPIRGRAREGGERTADAERQFRARSQTVQKLLHGQSDSAARPHGWSPQSGPCLWIGQYGSRHIDVSPPQRVAKTFWTLPWKE
jgi:hypothetical protein